MKGAFRLAVPTVLIAVCGVGGYSLGKILGGSAIPRPIRDAAQEGRQTAGSVDDRDMAFATLLEPANETADIWKVVSRMPPGQIADAIRQIEAQPGYLPRKSAILSALYFHWAESDPQAALADAEAMPDEEARTGLVRSVLAAWMRTDPDAAYDAVKTTESEYYGRTMLVQTWTPQSLFEALGRHLDKHRDLLGWYCASLDDKPEAREEMLATLARKPRMKDGDWGESLLFRKWGYRDFDAAIAKAQTQVSPHMKQQLVRENVEGQPHKVLPWAAKNGYPPGGPDWENGYANWLGQGNGAEARSWFKQQAPLWEQQGHLAAVASFYARDFGHAERLGLTNEQTAAGQGLAGVIERWGQKDPQAVRKWLDTTTDSARKYLNGNGGTEP
jgi:hypothetical protein